MTKSQVLQQVLQQVANELGAQLPEQEYSEFLGGGIDFHLDLALKPTRYFVRVSLPAARSGKKPKPWPLEFVFKRRHTRLIDRISAKKAG
jgi:hypothetical protein